MFRLSTLLQSVPTGFYVTDSIAFIESDENSFLIVYLDQTEEHLDVETAKKIIASCAANGFFLLDGLCLNPAALKKVIQQTVIIEGNPEAGAVIHYLFAGETDIGKDDADKLFSQLAAQEAKTKLLMQRLQQANKN